MKLRLITIMIVIAFLMGLINPLFSAPAADSAYIKSINLKKTGDKLEVSLISSKPVEYKVMNMTDPYVCLIIDIYPAVLTSDAKVFDSISCGVVKGVRIGQFSDNPDITRLVIDLKEETKYEVNTIKETPGIILSVKYDKENINKLAAAPAVKTDSMGEKNITASVSAEKNTVKEPLINVKKENKTAPAGVSASIKNAKETASLKSKTAEPLPAAIELIAAAAPKKETKVIEVKNVKTNSLSVTKISNQDFGRNNLYKEDKIKSSAAKKIPQDHISAVIADGSAYQAKKNISENKDIPVITNPAQPQVAQPQVAQPQAVVLPAKIMTAVKPVEPVTVKNTVKKDLQAEEKITVKKIDALLNEAVPVKNKVNEKSHIAYAPKNSSSTKKIVKKEPKEQTFNVEYDNEDIVFILNQLAKKTNKNIVTDSSVTGTVTVSLKNVTLDRALQVILKTSGLAYKNIDNIIVVSKPENLAKISSISVKKGFGSDTTAVIPINYASPETLKKAIQDIIPEMDITIDKRLNAFVISASDTEIKYVKSLVEQMDQLPSISGDPNTIIKVVKLKYGKVKEVQALITKWYPQIQLVVDERVNAFIVKDNKTNIEKLEKFIATVDAPKRQVQLDVKIVDLTETGAKALGVAWNGNTNIISTTFTEVANNFVPWQDVNNPNWPPISAPTYQDIPFTGFGRTPLTIPMTLSYLVTKGEAKILATPKIVTLSGEMAKMNVGQHYPMTYSDPRAGPGLQVMYLDTGIILEVRPYITPDGYIMAEVNPEISELAPSSVGTQYPETVTRKLKTNIIVKEGDTIILGGLYRKNYATTKNKIPLLGDMPFVGEMFKNNSDLSSKDEMVIMITPKIVNVGE